MSPSYAEFPDRGLMARSRNIKALGHDLASLSRHVPNRCMQAMMERGWLPRLEEFYERLVEQGDMRQALERAVNDFVYRRLLDLPRDGDRCASLLGAISIVQTPYRVAAR